MIFPENLPSRLYAKTNQTLTLSYQETDLFFNSDV